MSLIPSFYGGFGFSGFAIAQTVGITDAPPVNAAKPPVGDSVNPARFQQFVPRVTGPMAWNDISLDVNGACFNWNPGRGLIYDAPQYRLYSTYRKMDDHPTLSIIRHMAIDPILMATRTVKGLSKDTPPEWVDCIKEMFLPQLPMILSDIMRAMSFGWQPLEKVWEVRDGMMWCTLRAWYPDYSEIYLARQTGKFAGLKIMGGTDILPPNRCIPIVHNGEAHNLYGHSNHDAAYDAYNQWGRNQIDLMKLRAKLSGILPVLKYPLGEQPDGTDNGKAAQTILDSLGMGNGVALPSLGYKMEDMARNPDLAKISLWSLEFQDNGALSPAIAGYLAAKHSYDVDMFHAWGLPERTGMEGHHGTNAESGQHTDNSTPTKEVAAQRIFYQLNHGIPSMGVTGAVDDALLYNFGPEAVGQVEIEIAPLADIDKENKVKILQSVFTSTNTALVSGFVKSTNMDNWKSDLGIPEGDEPFDVDEFEDAATKAAVVVAPAPVPPGKTQPAPDLKLSRFKRRLAYADER